MSAPNKRKCLTKRAAIDRPSGKQALSVDNDHISVI